MMLVPVSTLLEGTAEPCCRKAWALTGGLGKVFAGRSKSCAEFILFFSTPPPPLVLPPPLFPSAWERKTPSMLLPYYWETLLPAVSQVARIDKMMPS